MPALAPQQGFEPQHHLSSVSTCVSIAGQPDRGEPPKSDSPNRPLKPPRMANGTAFYCGIHCGIHCGIGTFGTPSDHPSEGLS